MYKRQAWALDENATEAQEGFLLNHLISELKPGPGRVPNSDPITGQAAWLDLRVKIERVGPRDHAEPAFGPISRVVPQGRERA